MYLGQLCLSKCVLCFLIHKSCVRSIKKYLLLLLKYGGSDESHRVVSGKIIHRCWHCRNNGQIYVRR